MQYGYSVQPIGWAGAGAEASANPLIANNARRILRIIVLLPRTDVESISRIRSINRSAHARFPSTHIVARGGQVALQNRVRLGSRVVQLKKELTKGIGLQTDPRPPLDSKEQNKNNVLVVFQDMESSNVEDIRGRGCSAGIIDTFRRHGRGLGAGVLDTLIPESSRHRKNTDKWRSMFREPKKDADHGNPRPFAPGRGRRALWNAGEWWSS